MNHQMADRINPIFHFDAKKKKKKRLHNHQDAPFTGINLWRTFILSTESIFNSLFHLLSLWSENSPCLIMYVGATCCFAPVWCLTKQTMVWNPLSLQANSGLFHWTRFKLPLKYWFSRSVSKSCRYMFHTSRGGGENPLWLWKDCVWMNMVHWCQVLIGSLGCDTHWWWV